MSGELEFVVGVSERVVSSVAEWVGTPYHSQASIRGVGCDCLGLVRGVWHDVYGTPAEDPPGYSADWVEGSGEETLLDAAARHLVPVADNDGRIGDVLIFRHRPGVPAKHCGIVSATANGGLMIHAVERRGVVESGIGDWWHRRIAGRFRFPEIVG